MGENEGHSGRPAPNQTSRPRSIHELNYLTPGASRASHASVFQQAFACAILALAVWAGALAVIFNLDPADDGFKERGFFAVPGVMLVMGAVLLGVRRLRGIAIGMLIAVAVGSSFLYYVWVAVLPGIGGG